MNLRTKLATFALTLIAASSLLAGCGEQPAASTDNDAQTQFLEERKGTPDPNFTPVAGGGPGQMQFFAGPGDGGAFGTVEKVDGRNITLNNPMDGTKKVVHLADDAVVTTQADATLADLKAGDNITAIGKLDGDRLTAVTVQIGGDGSAGQMSFVGPGPGGAGPGSLGGAGGPGNNVITFDGEVPGTPQAAATIISGTPGPMTDGSIMEAAQVVVGTVETIDGQTVTVKDKDGKVTTVELTGTTQLHKEAELDPTRIEIGTMMTAAGELKGEVFEATSARILPAMQMMKR